MPARTVTAGGPWYFLAPAWSEGTSRIVPVAVLLETTTVSRCWDGSGPALVRIMVVCAGLATSKVDNPSLAHL